MTTGIAKHVLVLAATGLALAVVLGAGCAGGTAGAGPGGPVTIDVSATGLAFVPSSVTVSPGDTVRWMNNDAVLHTVTSDAANPAAGGPNSQSQYAGGIPSGQMYSWAVPAGASSGTVWYYHCGFHGSGGDGAHQGAGMAGTITVR